MADPASYKRMDADARRAQIMAAAYEVLASHGVDDFSTEAVARRADTSPQLLRHYFGTREGLLTEVASDLIDRALAILDAPPSYGGLEKRLDAYMEMIGSEPWAHAIWQHGAERDSALSKLIGDARRRVAARAFGGAPWAEMPRETQLRALGWAGHVESVIAAWIQAGQTDRETTLAVMVDTGRRLGVDGV